MVEGHGVEEKKVRHVDCLERRRGRQSGARGEGVEKATLVQSHRGACGGVRLSPFITRELLCWGTNRIFCN